MLNRGRPKQNLKLKCSYTVTKRSNYNGNNYKKEHFKFI